MSDGKSTRPRKKRPDLTGARFGRWLVLRYDGERPRWKHYWICKCDCGKVRGILDQNLTRGLSASCGCAGSRTTIGDRTRTHGGSKGSPIYTVWLNMRARCSDPDRPDYARYGGRGISVCPRWDRSFAAFRSDMGDRPFPGAQLDRIDNDGNYEPGNVRWATPSQNARNTRANRMLEFRGETRCVPEWADQTGIRYLTIHRRLDLGWSTERALTAPVRRTSRRVKR